MRLIECPRIRLPLRSPKRAARRVSTQAQKTKTVKKRKPAACRDFARSINFLAQHRSALGVRSRGTARMYLVPAQRKLLSPCQNKTDNQRRKRRLLVMLLLFFTY